MALPADISFKIKFDQTNSPANFSLEDNTDYGTLGISLDDVRGNFSNVLDPLGNVIHNNTDFSSPDIVASSSLLYTGLDIPTDVNSAILEGIYSFTYNIKTDAPIIAVTPGLSGTFTILGDAAALITADGAITVVRSTGNNGTYTVASAVFGGVNTVVTIVGSIPSATVDGSIQYASQVSFSKTQTATYEDVVPVVNIEVLTDCFCGNLTSIDKTDYTNATIVSRVHTVKYPAALAKADVVSSSATILVTPIYTKVWTSIVESELIINVSGGTISAIVTGSQDTTVDCDISLCDISCCMLALNNRYLDARIENPPLAAKYFADLTRMIQLAQMFRMAFECDQHDEAEGFLAEIKKVGNCSDACTCSGDEPAQVVPICGGNVNNVQVIAGAGITVTTTFQNNNYVYQVALSASMLAILNSVAPQNVVAGTGISVVQTLVAGVQTWTITNTAAFTAQNRLEFLTRIQYTGPTTATITNSAYLTSGSNINPAATVASTTLPTAGLNNNFRVSAFQVVPNNNYKVTLELVTVTVHGSTYSLNTAKSIDVEMLNKQSGQFDFRFIDPNGMTLTNTNIFKITDIYVNIKISE